MFPVLGERRRQLAGTLSGGEQRMLSMARVLVESPAVLVADELSLGLAPKIVDAVYGASPSCGRRATALLIVEQHVGHALDLCHRVLLLHHGTVTWEGPSADACRPGARRALRPGGPLRAEGGRAPRAPGRDLGHRPVRHRPPPPSQRPRPHHRGHERAVADAGLTLDDIDGVSTYPGTGGPFGGASGADLHDALRLRLAWRDGGLETAGQLGAVHKAVLAVAAGLAHHVVVFRTVVEGSGTVLRPGGAARWRRRPAGVDALPDPLRRRVGRQLDRPLRHAPHARLGPPGSSWAPSPSTPARSRR